MRDAFRDLRYRAVIARKAHTPSPVMLLPVAVDPKDIPWRHIVVRVVRWAFFTVSFALTPLIVLVLVQLMTETTRPKHLGESPELLFFGLMVGAGSFGDLWRSKPDWGVLGTVATVVLLGIALWAAIFYGIQTFALAVAHESPGAANLLANVVGLSIAVAVTAGLAGLAVQIGLAIHEGGSGA